MALTVVTVTGTFNKAPGVASVGQLEWQLSADLVQAGQPIASRKPIEVILDDTGAFSVDLWAVDDTGTAPTGAAWTLSGLLDGQQFNQTYVITKSMAPTIDLSQMTPAAIGNPVYPVNAAELQGRPVASTAPADGELLEWDATAGTWRPSSGAYVSVNEGPLYAEDPRLGMVGDGSTDNAGKDATIKTLLGVNGGTVKFRNGGLYLSSAAWNFDSTTGIVLDMGENNSDRDHTPSTELRFTTSGTAPLLSAKTSQGFTVKGGAVRYSSGSYTGRLVSVTGTGATPTYKPTFERTVLGGISSVGAINAAYVVDLGDTVEAVFDEAVIARAVAGVMGYDGSATYATATKFRGGRFADLSANAIQNPHQGWNLLGTVFENATGGGPSGIVGSSGFPALGLVVLGCWFGDSTTAGYWLDLYGDGVTVAGCYVLLPNVAGGNYARLNGTIHGFRSVGNIILGGTNSTYLTTANTPNVLGFYCDDSLINGISDNQGSLSGITAAASSLLAVRKPVKTITAATYTSLPSDYGYLLLFDCTSNAISYTLPDSQASGAYGQQISLKKVDSSANAVTINPVGGQRVDEGFSLSLAAQNNAYSLICDGALAPGGWRSVGKV